MEEKPFIPKNIDKIIHERTRLWIVSALAAQKKMSFVSLKKLLDLSDGNLNAHLRVLEDNEYIEVEKTFVKRKPRTTYRLTPKGKKEFRRYLDELEMIVKQFSSI